jgi:DNA (cytosine-5)-methyltransferase 1
VAVRPTAVSLFAGVGGIDLALERAGYDVVAAVEIDKAARGVIADQMPHTTLFDDVTKVSADDLRAAGLVPDAGLVAAGWPCQGNSVAGRRGGLADPRFDEEATA